MTLATAPAQTATAQALATAAQVAGFDGDAMQSNDEFYVHHYNLGVARREQEMEDRYSY